jgi:hypothetical protein
VALVFHIRSERLLVQTRVWDQQRAVLEHVQLAVGEIDVAAIGGRHVFEATDTSA